MRSRVRSPSAAPTIFQPYSAPTQKECF